MNDDSPLDAMLDGAIQAVHAEPQPTELEQRCLNKSQSLDPSARSNPSTRISRRALTWRVAAGMAIAASLAVWVSTWVVEPPLAMAQIRAALESVESLHLKMRTAPDGGNYTTHLYYRQDSGYKFVSPEWVVVDDGKKRYEYDVPENTVVIYPSRFQQQEHVSLEALGDAIGHRLADSVDEEFQRAAQLDETLDGQPLEAYQWSSDVGRTSHQYLWYVDAKRRPVLWISRFRPDPEAEWEVRNRIELRFVEVSPEQLAANFPAEAKRIERNNTLKEVDGKMYEEVVLETAAEIRDHWSDYYGWQFEIEIDVRRDYAPDYDQEIVKDYHVREYSPQDVHYRDEYAILPPLSGSDRPRRFWKRYQTEANGKQRLLAACAFDGEVTRRYCYRSDDYNRGLIAPWEDMTPIHDMPNYFEDLLVMKINFISGFAKLADGTENAALESMHLKDTVRSEGRTDYVFRGNREQGGELIEFDFEVAGEPCWRIRNYQIHITNAEGKRLNAKVAMDDLAKFDGGWYPASGRYQTFPNKFGDDLDYRFQVTQVTKFSEEAAEDWWFEWPARTAVSDLRTDETFATPREPMEQPQ